MNLILNVLTVRHVSDELQTEVQRTGLSWRYQLRQIRNTNQTQETG